MHADVNPLYFFMPKRLMLGEVNWLQSNAKSASSSIIDEVQSKTWIYEIQT